jgi:hypothetical protein
VSEISDTRPLTPAPAKLDIRFGGKVHAVSYEQAFALAFTLIDHKHFDEAARIFIRLQAITDRGPSALIMQAYCEAAALHFDSCSKPLTAAFHGENRSLAADLHSAFISYHVGIRQDAITALTEIANQHRELPTVCLVLGDMLHATGETNLAGKCWSLAVKRDWPNGSVAIVATRRMQSLPKSQTSTS